MCQNFRMTTMSEQTVELTFLERLAIAIGRGWSRKGDMAAFLDVDAGTVSRWVKGETTPNVATLRAIAGEAHVPFEWLKPTAEETMGLSGKYAPRDLNPEPTDIAPFLVDDMIGEIMAHLAAVHA